MADFILFMHNDVQADDGWDSYLGRLRQLGAFEGGSGIGEGICLKKAGSAPPITERLVGYIKIVATDMQQAKSLVVGNPHYEAGGTVEIRELPRT